MIYLDTSALLKTIFAEAHTSALKTFIGENDAQGFVSSVLLTVEMRRAVNRVDSRQLPKADLELSRVTLVELSDAVIEMAGRFPDPHLRTLDAIHLATARLVREELTAVISYDKRMITVAHSEGLPVLSPGDGS
ncbi:MAG TPA: type II toxin-antitoxin system VapC family toxin [Mycobacteriales bacterium]|nr:type II toxin-antitoxin system VapC family toxin [Mycobacteriales bacterium]